MARPMPEEQPVNSGWLMPHHREELGGRPFGDGSPPGPPSEDERVPAEHTPLVAMSSW